SLLVSGLIAGGLPYTPGAYAAEGQVYLARIAADGSRFHFAAHVPGRGFPQLTYHMEMLEDRIVLVDSPAASFRVRVSARTAWPCSEKPLLLELDAQTSQPVFGTYLKNPLVVTGETVLSFNADASGLEALRVRDRGEPHITCVAHGATFESLNIAPGELITIFG